MLIIEPPLPLAELAPSDYRGSRRQNKSGDFSELIPQFSGGRKRKPAPNGSWNKLAGVSCGKFTQGDYSMYQRFVPLAVIALIACASSVYAQCSCGLSPAYAPAAAAYAPVAPSYTTSYAPAVVDYAPVTYATYYAAPAAYAPAPYVSYYAPAAYAPAPYVSYYAPPVSYAAYYAPSVAVAPVVAPYRAYYGTPGWSIYGTPRVYVPGEPVRNTLKAVTP
jgi:hypothetical protein